MRVLLNAETSPMHSAIVADYGGSDFLRPDHGNLLIMYNLSKKRCLFCLLNSTFSPKMGHLREAGRIFINGLIF